MIELAKIMERETIEIGSKVENNLEEHGVLRSIKRNVLEQINSSFSEVNSSDSTCNNKNGQESKKGKKKGSGANRVVNEVKSDISNDSVIYSIFFLYRVNKPSENSSNYEPEVVLCSLGAGKSNLSKSKLLNKSEQIRDFHAEILACRAFRRFILKELTKISKEKGKSKFFKKSKSGLFRLKYGWKLGIFCSRMPCGDCSVFQTTDSEIQLFSNACSLKKYKEAVASSEDTLSKDNGVQDDYEVRIKPVRRDFKVSDINPCLSCSDKLMLWSCLGVQGKLISGLLEEPLVISMHLFPLECEKLTKSEEKLGQYKRKLESSLNFYRRLESNTEIKKRYRDLCEGVFRLNEKEKGLFELRRHQESEIVFYDKNRLFQRDSSPSNTLESKRVDKLGTQPTPLVKKKKKATKYGKLSFLTCLEDSCLNNQDLEVIQPKTGLKQGTSLKQVGNPKVRSTYSTKNLKKLITDQFGHLVHDLDFSFLEASQGETSDAILESLKRFGGIGFSRTYFLRKTILKQLFY